MSDRTPTMSTRIALITGAAQGLGVAIALRLADDGLDVAVNDIESKSQELQTVVSAIEARGRRGIAITADVSSEQQVQDMIATVVDKLGGLDVMVANAGVGELRPLLQMSVDEWDATMAVNARGVMLCYKYAALQMIKQGRGGRIIGASSVAGKKALLNAGAYSASKFAVRGITQSAALELSPHKITVNAYGPGFIMTPLYSGLMQQLGDPDGAQLKKLLGYPPDCPVGEPNSVASAVSYLAKPESYFITGQTMVIDGGTILD